jgi:hypothetical protein
MQFSSSNRALLEWRYQCACIVLAMFLSCQSSWAQDPGSLTSQQSNPANAAESIDSADAAEQAVVSVPFEVKADTPSTASAAAADHPTRLKSKITRTNRTHGFKERAIGVVLAPIIYPLAAYVAARIMWNFFTKGYYGI